MTIWISGRHSIAAGMAAALLVMCGAAPAVAQGVEERKATIDQGYITEVPAPVRTVLPSRLRNLERLEFEADDLERRRLDMSDSQLRIDIRDQLERAGVECEVGEFKRLGSTGERDLRSIYEAVCANGPGYVLVNGVEPSATNCLVLAGGAANARRRDPNAALGALCELPANQDNSRLISAWASEAGVACRVDQAEWLGPGEGGLDIYEVGCDGTEGYWLEKTASGWSLVSCLQISAEGQTCRFTEPGEQHSWMRTRLAGTPAETCDVAEIRPVGVSSQGHHYEARCRAAGEGYLVRIAGDGQVDDVVPCTEADQCVLTAPGTSEG